MTTTIILGVIGALLLIAAIVLFCMRNADRKNFVSAYAGANAEYLTPEMRTRHERTQKGLLIAAIVALVAAIGCGIAAGVTAAEAAQAAEQQAQQEQEEADKEAEEAKAQAEAQAEAEAKAKAEAEAKAKESMDKVVTEVDNKTKSMDDEASNPYLKKWGDEVDMQSLNYQLPSGQMNDYARAQKVGWAWAPTYGFTATDDEGKFEEFRKWLWANPVYGDGFAQFLEVHGFTTNGRNPWISEMIALAHNQGYQNLEHPDDGFWYHDGTTWRTTKKWQYYAACLESVAEQLTVLGMTDEYIVEHWPLDMGPNNKRYMYLSTENPQVQHGLKLGFKDKFGPEGKGSIIFAFLVDDADGRLEVPGDQPTVVTDEVEYYPGTYTPDEPYIPPYIPPDNPPTPPDNPNMKDPSQDPVNQGNAPIGGGKNQPDDGSGDFEETDHPAQSSDASPDAGNDDGSSKPSNQVQDPSAHQDNSEAPAIPDKGIVEDATPAHDESGTNVDEVTNKGTIELDD